MADRARFPARGAAAVLLTLPALLGGCGLFGSDDEADARSVFEVEPGMCFETPQEVEAQVDDLAEVSCDQPHGQEAYAVVTFTPDEDSDAFPGEEALQAFADGHCAEEFRGYVGIDYLDSALFFTYLVPSPRSWEQDDRQVLCMITTAGEPLRGSVKDSKR
jgi:hypothetical protein